jgi:cysteine-rich repeat protein
MKRTIASITLTLFSCFLFACGDNFAQEEPASVCGDGVIGVGEGCDDGNLTDNDGCDSNCKFPFCGNGILAFDEACDDGNMINGDGCDQNCTESYCGNGFVGLDEECDDGNTVSGDGCDANCKPTGCGNGVPSTGEPCDDGNGVEGDGCDTNCTVSACGNGIMAPNEACDDGNTAGADGCSGSCAMEVTEIEPNEDGTISTGGSVIAGNDFAIANADTNGAFTTSASIVGALTPAGDEDVFKFRNMGTVPVRMKIDTWNLATGFGSGVSCGTASIDTGINVRNAAGTILSSNNDRVAGDRCAGLVHALFPGQTVYVHVTENGDNAIVTSYALDVVYVPVICGDGDVGPGEQCDDSNTAVGDGCSATCQIEGAFTEIEPNEDGTPSTGGSGINGNDFGSTSALANGVVTGNATAIATITPLGDEDVFAFRNAGTTSVIVSLDVWNLATGFGIGVPCGTSIDTGMHVRDAGGSSNGSNDDRNGAIDRCSTLKLGLAPGQTRFAHVISYGDNSLIAQYALVFKYAPVVCGNGVIEFGETCDDSNTTAGDGCDAMCKIEPICGNSMLEPSEQCDDGNTTAGDGCNATCKVEGAVTEVEPNEDGSPSPGGPFGIDGNDFGSANPTTNGAFTTNVKIAATIDPAGDEDVFAFTNTSATFKNLRLDVWNLAPTFGVGTACGASINLGLTVRNAAGAALASNDDRNGATDRCPGLTYGVAPGQTVFAHVVEADDNAVVLSYALVNSFNAVVCGDGNIGPGEQCDDSNTNAGDGCSATCQIEGAVGEIEPNEDGTPSTGGSTTTGNDYASANALANGVITGTTTFVATISPLGDEDVFAFRNTGTSPVQVNLDVWNLATGFGIGVPCGTSIDTAMHVRDAAGVSAAVNDDRNGAIDRCSTLTVTLAPGQTSFAHVIEYNDDALTGVYALQIKYVVAVCGNYSNDAGEQCDDGNVVSGDGCSATCTLEATAEIEPNNTTANADANGIVITGDKIFTGAFAVAGDKDVYKVTVATPTVVRFESFTSWGQCPTATFDMRLLNSAGTEIALDEEAGGVNSCAALVVFLPAGTYYAQLEETDNNAAVPAYILDVQFQTDRGSEVEPNATTATANATLLTFNESYLLGDHMMQTDADVFSITVPAGGRIRAEVIEGNTETCESLGLDSRLTLFDDTGAELADDDDGSRGYCSLIDGTGASPQYPGARNASTTSKTYYLMVRASTFSQTNADGQFAYRLQVTVRAP